MHVTFRYIHLIHNMREQLDFNRLYHFFMVCIHHVTWKLGICLSIGTSFVLIDLQKRAQGDKIGFNVKQ